jgi:hypothetical protein
MLALRANRTVSVDALIDGLWGDRPTASAAKNVQHYIWRLRKALDANGSGAQIVTRGRGYELQLPEEAVDASRFERLVERARREAEHGIADGAVKGALELWRGAPLADVASEPFAGPEIRRLEELHLRALELTIDAELAAGRVGSLHNRRRSLGCALMGRQRRGRHSHGDHAVNPSAPGQRRMPSEQILAPRRAPRSPRGQSGRLRGGQAFDCSSSRIRCSSSAEISPRA